MSPVRHEIKVQRDAKEADRQCPEGLNFCPRAPESPRDGHHDPSAETVAQAGLHPNAPVTRMRAARLIRLCKAAEVRAKLVVPRGVRWTSDMIANAIAHWRSSTGPRCPVVSARIFRPAEIWRHVTRIGPPGPRMSKLARRRHVVLPLLSHLWPWTRITSSPAHPFGGSSLEVGRLQSR